MSPSFRREVTGPPCPPDGIVLRVMKASDVPQVRALHRSLLPVSYPAAFFVQLLVHPRHLCLIATDGGAVVGFASAAMDLSQPSSVVGCRRHAIRADRESSELRSDIARLHITLLTLGVLPAYQRRGIGRSLVHGVVRRLEEASWCSAGQRSRPAQDHAGVLPGEEGKSGVVVRAQVAHANFSGRCFYARLGMMDQRESGDPRLRLGHGARTSVVAGVLSV